MDLVLSKDETDLIADCVNAIGSPDFPRLICQFCASLCHSDNVYLTVLFDDRAPVALYGNHGKASQRVLLELYLDAAYLLDPFVLHFRKKLGDEVLSLDDIAPDNFKRSEYFSKFFRDMGLTDECGMILHFGNDTALFFSLGNETAGFPANPERLRKAQPIVASLARRHWANLSPENTDGSGRLGAHLQSAFEAFGTSVLSPREGEIVRMILKGHSSKAIAREFDNSPETIKVHRKRIYTKLRIASQGELLSIFLEALSRTPAAATRDPLEFYTPPE
jgi:DNA-binding CsgD family transcriptional regulator